MVGFASRMFVSALLLLATWPGARAEETPDQPIRSDLTVQVGVRLLFLDVEVLDENGEPVPGLTQDDFTVHLNHRAHPVHSVDDLCGCATDGETLLPSPNFVLYFDFSQMGPRGRETALREAERWLREVKEPEDRATVVAYATESGLRQLCPLTDDVDRLLEAILAAADDSALIDPFPARYAKRVELCSSGTTSCHNAGMQEYRQTQQSAKVLLHFLTRMEALPGRKALLLFYQNNAVYPGHLYTQDRMARVFYDGKPSDTVPNVERMVGELSGTAVATGTVVYPLSSGPAGDWSIDFGEGLARTTGGRFNRDASELSAVLDEAGRGCACMYRIGLEPPESKESRVLRARVAVGDGGWLEPNFRLLQLTEEDRWRRTSGAVLLDPESADDIPVAAGIIPISATGKRWDVRLQVAIDPRSLGLLPSGTNHVASYEVGAILVRQGGSRPVEMLGVSRVSCPKEGCGGTVVHERTVEGLTPGVWELRAFAHDRWTDAYGGAKAMLELPRPGKPSIAGPVPVAANESYIAADLPLWRKKSNAGESTGIRTALGDRPLADGEIPTAMLTWVCGAKTGERLPEPGRLLLDGAPISGVERTAVESIGRCWSLRDDVDTSSLAPGRYVYALAGSPETLESAFEIAGLEPEPGSPVDDVPEVAVVVEQASSPAMPEVKTKTAVPPEPAPLGPQASDAAPRETERAAPALKPSNVRLEELLEKVARQAGKYRDTALRFTCDETVLERQGPYRSQTLKFEYVYAYDDEGNLRDRRMTLRAGRQARKGKPVKPLDLAETDLPAYVLRAYSAIFIFERSIQRLYEFEILGEEEALGRPAVKVRFAAVPPHVEDLNDWFGAAWVDLETWQPLRVWGLKVEDHEKKLIFDRGIEQSTTRARRRRYYFDEINVEFAVERVGIRFPSRVVTLRKEFETWRGADYLRTPAREEFRVVQSYDNYRIYGVTTAEELNRIAE